MKKSEIASIVLIAAISLGIAYFLAQSILGSPKQQKISVPTTELITENIEEPSTKIFNSDAINPTVRITIGESGDQQPFTN